jgi:hypothetical protein
MSLRASLREVRTFLAMPEARKKVEEIRSLLEGTVSDVSESPQDQERDKAV